MKALAAAALMRAANAPTHGRDLVPGFVIEERPAVEVCDVVSVLDLRDADLAEVEGEACPGLELSPGVEWPMRWR